MAGMKIKDICMKIKNNLYKQPFIVEYRNSAPVIVTPKTVLLNNMSRNPDLTYENYFEPSVQGCTSKSQSQKDCHVGSTGFSAGIDINDQPYVQRKAMDEVIERWNEKPKMEYFQRLKIILS
ncbi:uncharacterized protein LOC105393551 [Plutella xylostella]|uniref:uncharacterized protein LOC105393551 n=1 Tax=Plutella xylostella TaxID=51655 RepID=UPI00203252E1|nr:uncharacterized protein LOC105393551 [Plutella xylostella]